MDGDRSLDAAQLCTASERKYRVDGAGSARALREDVPILPSLDWHLPIRTGHVHALQPQRCCHDRNAAGRRDGGLLGGGAWWLGGGAAARMCLTPLVFCVLHHHYILATTPTRGLVAGLLVRPDSAARHPGGICGRCLRCCGRCWGHAACNLLSAHMVHLTAHRPFSPKLNSKSKFTVTTPPGSALSPAPLRALLEAPAQHRPAQHRHDKASLSPATNCLPLLATNCLLLATSTAPAYHFRHAPSKVRRAAA